VVAPIPDVQQRYVTLAAVLRRTSQSMVDELIARLEQAGFPTVRAAYHPVFENINRDGTRLTDLAARAAMTRQSMSELVAVMERQGFLERRADPTDGRARLICLTSEGRRLVRTALGELRDIEAKWTGRWRRAGSRGDLRRILEHALVQEI
jgi:DNA-binding MarR family transcriptional regulator